MPRTGSKAPAALRLWVVFCALCNVAGWGLSAIHQLNATGYIAVFAVAGITIMCMRRHLFGERRRLPPLRRLQRRFRRPFPLAFLVLACLAILGGVLYAPANPDGLSHRLPRLLNWLAEERWYWMPFGGAMNSRPCGFEWIMAPMVALTRTDRWIFVYNAASFLLLPGLLFGVLTRLGVRRRAAWHWMWIVPSGYCFLLQAGSIGNDAAGAVLALAAVYFALRARASGSHGDLWLSILAAATMTAVKSSNLALLLPWCLAVLPGVKLLLARPVATGAIALAALAASFFPTAVLNTRYVGDWSAMSAETPLVQQASPGILLAGNLLNLALQNVVPPVFPAARWWNEHAYHALPQWFMTRLETFFEPGGAHLHLGEIQFETSAGLGMGVTILLLVSWAMAARLRPAGRVSRWPQSGGAWLSALIRWSPFVVLAAFCLKTAMSTSARIVTPYYCFFLPFFLAGPGMKRLVRSRAWRCAAFLAMIPALVLVIINPPRPLWPAQTVLKRLAALRPDSKSLGLAATLYSSYATSWDALADVRELLPPGVRKVGFIPMVMASSLETSLWRPFGERQVINLPREITAERIAALGIRYVAVGAWSSTARIRDVPVSEWIENWCHARNGRIVGTARARHRATMEEALWYVIELAPPSDAANPGKPSSP